MCFQQGAESRQCFVSLTCSLETHGSILSDFVLTAEVIRTKEAFDVMGAEYHGLPSFTLEVFMITKANRMNGSCHSTTGCDGYV